MTTAIRPEQPPGQTSDRHRETVPAAAAPERPAPATGHRPGGEPPVLTERHESLLVAAGRAPSVHNTQPWRFRIADDVVELYADTGRRLEHTDPDGREMLISCGAALFGLRLGVRLLGFRPVVELLPEQAAPKPNRERPETNREPETNPAPREPADARLELLARVRLGDPAPLAPAEQQLLTAVPRRHTHRGAFTTEPLPVGLIPTLQRDAEAERAALVPIQEPRRHKRLAALVAAADRRQRLHPRVAAELASWTRAGTSQSRDGVPARAYTRRPGQRPGGLVQRDFDAGREWGTLPTPAMATPVITTVLVTTGDAAIDWLNAGQALYRLLLRAAGAWVFASMHSQPMEVPQVRAAMAEQLGLPGAPHMVLQLGRARIAALTTRRPVADLLIQP